ncbi:replicative DNA helicase [Rubellicoccus peritrichatus]|uniref:Replicative DNA helicase n=1 Tax=Rubellicoccus peritrichatus TaxID=3080537 RepID=A0AAQ3LC83_9BACT|nr:replicative DNA helicase [Puniceicoccus sp. CR14]WOO41185.1 replicative DNA helicase [Puniceicoccus sp. CR14]
MADRGNRRGGKSNVIQWEQAMGDRTPPHNIEMEQALLACIILEGGNESFPVCIQEKVRPESFYSTKHQLIYAAMTKLYEAGVAPINEVLLIDQLKKEGTLDQAGGDNYMIEITNRIDTPVGLQHYVERVRDGYLLREIIRASNEAIESVYDDPSDVQTLIDGVEQRIFKINEDRISDSARPVKESIDTAMAMVNNFIQRRGDITGVSTGFLDLDKMTTGWHATEMIVVAARPSMGKTSLALNMAEAAILPNGDHEATPTLLFSLEMGADQLAMRLLCSRGRVNMTKLRDGFLPREKQQDLMRTAKELQGAPLYIDDSSGLNILELRAKARRQHNQLPNGLGLVIVDYLQLVAGTDPRVPREQQIAEISRGMKGMAKELNIPVIVLGQLNRESEKEKRQPRISDLRESGSIEQDADIVLLLSKPKENRENEDMTLEVVPRDLIIAKQRNGPIGTVTLHFTKNLTRFENYTPHSA